MPPVRGILLRLRLSEDAGRQTGSGRGLYSSSVMAFRLATPLGKKKGKNSLDFIKILNVCSFKDPVKKMKRQAKTGRKYLQTTYPVSRKYQELSTFNSKKKNPIRK